MSSTLLAASDNVLAHARLAAHQIALLSSSLPVVIFFCVFFLLVGILLLWSGLSSARLLSCLIYEVLFTCSLLFLFLILANFLSSPSSPQPYDSVDSPDLWFYHPNYFWTLTACFALISIFIAFFLSRYRLFMSIAISGSAGLILGALCWLFVAHKSSSSSPPIPSHNQHLDNSGLFNWILFLSLFASTFALFPIGCWILRRRFLLLSCCFLGSYFLIRSFFLFLCFLLPSATGHQILSGFPNEFHYHSTVYLSVSFYLTFAAVILLTIISYLIHECCWKRDGLPMRRGFIWSGSNNFHYHSMGETEPLYTH